MGNTLEFIVVIVAMSLWFIFPLGLFMAMNSIDRYGEHLVQTGQKEKAEIPVETQPLGKKIKQHWHPHWPAFIQRLRHHKSKTMARP